MWKKESGSIRVCGDEWMIKSFDEVFEDATKLGVKIKTDEYHPIGKYQIIDQGQEAVAGYSDLEDGVFENVPAIVFGDHTRIVKYVDQPFFLGADGVKVLRSRFKDANYRYLYYALKSMKIPNTGYNRHFKWLKEAKIYYPNSEEQSKIVLILDEISSVIEHRQRQLQKLDELVKARFVEMFGDPIMNPKRYPVHQLSEYISSLTSGSRGWAQYCVENGTEWFITIKNVKDCHITTDNMQPVNAPDNAEAKRTKVQEGDLLISITADLGRTGVVTKEIAEHGAYINQHLSCIRVNKEVLHPLFVAHYMESPAGKEQFTAKNQSAVKAGLNFNSINSLKLYVPPLKEQEEFITFITQVTKSKVAVQKALDEAQLLFDSLMQQYFG
jgi:type I restriction enzyme S subunit